MTEFCLSDVFSNAFETELMSRTRFGHLPYILMTAEEGIPFNFKYLKEILKYFKSLTFCGAWWVVPDKPKSIQHRIIQNIGLMRLELNFKLLGK